MNFYKISSAPLILFRRLEETARKNNVASEKVDCVCDLCVKAVSRKKIWEYGKDNVIACIGTKIPYGEVKRGNIWLERKRNSIINKKYIEKHNNCVRNTLTVSNRSVSPPGSDTVKCFIAFSF